MNYVMRISAFFIACLLSLQSWGALLFQADFETALTKTPLYVKSAQPRAWLINPNVWSNGWCYTQATHGYESYSISTRYKRTGTSSILNTNNTMNKSDACNTVGVDPSLLKSRQEMVLGMGIPELTTDVPSATNFVGGVQMGEEIWYGASYYYPSDEGTNAQWWNAGNPRMNIVQFMAQTPCCSPELFVMLGNSGRVDFQIRTSSPSAPTEQVIDTYKGQFQMDRWNDLVIRWKRGYDNTGIFQAWINGVQVANRVNQPVSIHSKVNMYIAAGQYNGTDKTSRIYAQYLDAIKIGGANSSLAEVSPGGITCPGDPSCTPLTDTVIETVNGGLPLETEQYPVNFTANADSINGFLSCYINNTNEKPVIYNIATKAGYFRAPSLSGYTSTTATLKCLHESQLAKVTPDTSWAEHGTTEAEWSGNRFGLTSGLTITKAATASSYITTGDAVNVYAAIPTWTATSSWEVEFDVIFPTSTVLPFSTTSLIDGVNANNRASIYLEDSSNKLKWNTTGITSVSVDGVTVASDAYSFPTDGVVRHIKATGSDSIVLANVLRRYDNTNYANSTVFNLSLKQLSTPANDSFYALNESIASSTVFDTGARAQNGTWNNRVAGDITDLGAPAQNPAYAYKIPNTNSAFSGVASDRMALDFLYSCVGADCNNLYFAVKDKATGDHRLTAEGSAGALTLGTLNGGFGTTTSVKNWIVDATAGVYKARINFRIGTEGYNNIYDYYAGSKDASVGHTFVLHDVIPHKNYTTAPITHPITLTLTDADNPDLSGCTMPVVLDPQSGTYTAAVNCTTTELGGEYFVMLRDTNAVPADSDVVIAGTGAFRSVTGPVDSLSISAEFSGLAYQDLWAYIVHKDAADNVSAVASVSFDDGVGSGQEKKIKFSDDKLKRGANYLTCTGSCSIDHFKVYARNPLVYTGEPVLAHWQSVQPSVGTMELTESSIFDGSVNNLNPGVNYWWFLFDEDKDPLFFGEKTITVE